MNCDLQDCDRQHDAVIVTRKGLRVSMCMNHHRLFKSVKDFDWQKTISLVTESMDLLFATLTESLSVIGKRMELHQPKEQT